MSKNTNKMLLKIINNTLCFYKEVIFSKGFKEVDFFLEYTTETSNVKKFHNPDGPAIIIWNNNKIKRIEFWINGKRHRKWGPAIAYFEVSKGKLNIINEQWFMNNIELTEKEIEHIKLKLNRINKLKKFI